ncbi:MAG: hypothetical protein HN758_06625 [Verrucomicrobia bacterium]|jgi:hypothetical protein|nr:hypothetical protein [Verrucomicrobiota bacterium]MBT4274706.1 hypothetical protein [Verrucomicrobiota bacterium]MBT5062916.1 hypothetical protein [Verrucomicrobiota bacterium]MBT5480164.1 hypothetical protein [Verrucomicrobiota bacterium]MBT6236892.1 hypothetical protein [Verrucomicrobiota bacterium]
MNNPCNLLVAGAVALILSQSNTAQGESWKDNTIAPVTNPFYFEAAQVNTELRPVFIHHEIPSSFLGGGDANVYGVQARWAVNDRLALIATKGGICDLDMPAAGINETGWADLGFGLKYAAVDDEENQLLITPGLKLELPSGSGGIFQNNGDGEWNVFVSAMKGFDDLHFTGSVGARIPNDNDEESSFLHWSAQVDYYTCKWFIPFIAFNSFTVLSGGDGATPVEGYDLINFGSAAAEGDTYSAIGFGFRSRLHDRVDLGLSYENGVGSNEGIMDERYIVDMVIRF